MAWSDFEASIEGIKSDVISQFGAPTKHQELTSSMMTHHTQRAVGVENEIVFGSFVARSSAIRCFSLTNCSKVPLVCNYFSQPNHERNFQQFPKV